MCRLLPQRLLCLKQLLLQHTHLSLCCLLSCDSLALGGIRKVERGRELLALGDDRAHVRREIDVSMNLDLDVRVEHPAKSAVARPNVRKFLGFSFTNERQPRRRIRRRLPP